MRFACDRLDLGEPALYTAGGGVQWYVFDDERVGLIDLAVLGKVAANLGTLNITVAGKTRAQIRAEIIAWVETLAVVWPESINYTGSTNPFQTTLTANGAPATVQAAAAVPATLTPE